ncbi:MAG: hypothetical protein C6Y22_28010 [Hapalosiphonaceae cyanobacterium JJU2]|nr:MAG: hypothetical protein C6Y22_28010 [Hapalosiphonaceae cyanobacterium JJU2]
MGLSYEPKIYFTADYNWCKILVKQKITGVVAKMKLLRYSQQFKLNQLQPLRIDALKYGVYIA